MVGEWVGECSSSLGPDDHPAVVPVVPHVLEQLKAPHGTTGATLGATL